MSMKTRTVLGASMAAVWIVGCSAPAKLEGQCARIGSEAVIADAGAPNPDAPVETEVVSGDITFVIRASRAVHLVYVLDCLSGLTPCSQPAFEAVIGLDDGDRAALADWKALHDEYEADFVPRVERMNPAPLPIQHGSSRGFGAHVRIAGFGAGDDDAVLDRMAILLAPTEVATAAHVMQRFRNRVNSLWRSRRDDLARMAAAFAALLVRPDVTAITRAVEHFYSPDLPPHAREYVELFARPEHEGPDYGLQLADHAIVEVLPDQAPNARLAVVLHELFHRWYASAPYAKKRAFVDAVQGSSNLDARPAYALLNEVLSVCFGNGLVARTVNRPGFDESYARVRGLYSDRFIDVTAKAVLPWIETYLGQGKTLYDPEFLEHYLRTVSSVFAKGIPPALHLRPHVALYEASLTRVGEHFERTINAGAAATEVGFDKDGREMLARFPVWSHVFLVLSAHVATLQGVEKNIDANVLGTLRVEAAKKQPFVWSATREHAAPLYVLVALDPVQFDGLIDRFAAQESLPPGVWR